MQNGWESCVLPGGVDIESLWKCFAICTKTQISVYPIIQQFILLKYPQREWKAYLHQKHNNSFSNIFYNGPKLETTEMSINSRKVGS